MTDSFWPPSSSGGVTTISGLTDTQIATPVDRDILEFDVSTGKWTNVGSTKLVTGEETGFPNRTDTTLAASVSAGVGGTLTLGKVGATFDIYIKGKKYTKVADEVFTIPAATALYFCKYDSTGTPDVSTTPWDLTSDVPVAIIYYNDSTGDYFIGEERHGMTMDSATHYRLHHATGSAYYSGFGAYNYTLNDNTGVLMQLKVDAGTFGDEDITNSVAAKSNALLDWDLWHRSGVAGDWQKHTGSIYPIFYASSIPKINTDPGGGWQLTSVSNNYYFNTYIFASNSTESTNRFIVIPGQAEYATPAEAEQEAINSLSLGTMPTIEFVPVCQITMQYKTSYTGNAARCEYKVVKDLRGTSNPGIPSSGVTHNSLPGRTDANAHPSASISTEDVTLAGQLDNSVDTNLGLITARLDDFGYASNWATSLAYRVGNVVKVDHKLFICIVAHTSGVFDTDLTTNGYWNLVGSGGTCGSLSTTDATPTVIGANTVPADVSYAVQVKISAHEVATGDSKTWDIMYSLKRVGATLTVTKVNEFGSEDAGAAAWTAVCSAVGTAFTITVTGEAAHTIEWHATTEHSYF